MENEPETWPSYCPDGLTETDIDALISEAFEVADEAAAAPTSALLDGTAAERRRRRIERQAVGGVVRSLPVIQAMGEEAA